MATLDRVRTGDCEFDAVVPTSTPMDIQNKENLMLVMNPVIKFGDTKEGFVL